MTAVELDDVLQFMRVLWVIVHSLQKTSKRMSRHLGVTGPQRLVIRVVGLSPGISAGGLARVLHLHPSTLTGVLKRLESQGTLSRVAHAGDARRSVLRLTPKGQRINTTMEGTVESVVRATLQGVTARDQRTVREVLALVADRLEASTFPASTRAGRTRARRRTA
jgi:DNA-binding MarR family transcriptional regulator